MGEPHSALGLCRSPSLRFDVSSPARWDEGRRRPILPHMRSVLQRPSMAALSVCAPLIIAGCVAAAPTPTTPTTLAAPTKPAPLPVEEARITKQFDASGFSDVPGKSLVIANCTGCHSGRLVQQNRATRAGWHQIVRWMQAKQGLWRLAPDVERGILDYLTAEYGPDDDSEDGRRPGLAPHLMPPAIPPDRALPLRNRGAHG